MNSLFLEKSIPELIEGINQGNLSFKDMADAVERAIAEHESNTLAWVVYDQAITHGESELAFQNYKTRGYSFGLEGIPVGIKDIFNTKSFSTQMGSPIWKDFTPGNDARVVDSLRKAGAVIAGKTVTAEFAVHALNETLNPHDKTKTPGTSSSGSAAAVATGMVPVALGTQTAGSIVRPASFCGVWGMKPSFGLIPRTGVLKTTDSLDTIGFLAAHAKSLRSMLDHTRVTGPDYPFVYKNIDARGDFPKDKRRPWRIGFAKTHVWDSAEDYVKKSVENLAEKIDREIDFEVEEIEWPEKLSHSHEIHTTIYAKSLSYYFQHEKKMSSQITPMMNDMITGGETITPNDFKKALIQQELYCATLEQLFEPYDMILSIGTSSSAPLRRNEELPDPSLIWTLGHIPVVAAPVFRCPVGLPYGVQFVSRKWNDYVLLQGVEELVKRSILPTGSQKILD